MDSDTLVLSHQFDFLNYHCEFHWSSGQTKWLSFELVGFALDVKTQVFPGLWVYWNMEISVPENYGCYPFACLQGSPYALWALHFEFL